MRKRTRSRELALKFLYRLDITKEDPERLFTDFRQEHRVTKAVREFTAQIARGVIANLPQIDSLISKCARNWQLKRMAVIDRNILRMGCFELLFLEDVPPKVSINEAVELAKKYGDTESGKFVNGILDKINKVEVGKKVHSFVNEQ